MKTVLTSICFLMTSACAEVGVLAGGASQTATFHYTLATSVDMFAKEADITNATGFNIANEDRARNALGFMKGTNMAVAVGIGAMKDARIDLVRQPGNSAVEVAITLAGNFNYAKRENADEIFAQVKAALVD